MFKYNLGQLVYYLKNNRLHSAEILSRKFVDNLREDWASTKEQKNLFTRFGKGQKLYGTVHGTFEEENLFESEEALRNGIV